MNEPTPTRSDAYGAPRSESLREHRTNGRQQIPFRVIPGDDHRDGWRHDVPISPTSTARAGAARLVTLVLGLGRAGGRLPPVDAGQTVSWPQQMRP